MITLNPDFVGNIDRAPKEVIVEERRIALEANNQKLKTEKQIAATKKRRVKRKHAKMQKNIWDEKREKLAQQIEERKRKQEEQEELETANPTFSVLNRFKKKKT